MGAGASANSVENQHEKVVIEPSPRVQCERSASPESRPASVPSPSRQTSANSAHGSTEKHVCFASEQPTIYTSDESVDIETDSTTTQGDVPNKCDYKLKCASKRKARHLLALEDPLATGIVRGSSKHATWCAGSKHGTIPRKHRPTLNTDGIASLQTEHSKPTGFLPMVPRRCLKDGDENIERSDKKAFAQSLNVDSVVGAPRACTPVKSATGRLKRSGSDSHMESNRSSRTSELPSVNVPPPPSCHLSDILPPVRQHHRQVTRPRGTTSAGMGLHGSASAPNLHANAAFKVGDQVTLNSGSDVPVGIWRNMGSGIVIGSGAKKGYLAIQFHSNYEVFDLKATNLVKVD